MLRGHIHDTKAFAASTQRRILTAAGVIERAIYVDNLAAALKSCRKGDLIAVADWRGLGSSRRQIVAALDMIHDAGFAAVEAPTMRRSDGRYAGNLLDEAIAKLANDKRGPDALTARAAGRKGGKANAKRIRQDRMPKTMAATYWLDRAISTEQALAKMNSDPNYTREWTKASAYRILGNPKRMPGRRATKS